jgi:hypothetical protein
MKTIKTAVGIRKIEDCSESILLDRIKDILTDHRNALINRLILDLPTYIIYKFKEKPTTAQLQTITDKLYSMKHFSIDLDKYDSVVRDIQNNSSTYLGTEQFYKDIDGTISWELRPNQMALAQN